LVKGHFGDESMELCNVGAVYTGIVVSVVESRV